MVRARDLALAWLLVLSLLLAGCGGAGGTAQAGTGTPVTPPGLALLDYLAQALSAATVQQMRSDQGSVLARYEPGVNVLSTAQYGDRLLEGTVDLGDVFDARVPANALAFQTWAAQQGLVACEFPEDHVSIYSDAAADFLAFYQYDCVVFFPDEFHPVFTHPTDTWVFLRELPQPGGPPTNFHSSRMVQRRVTLGGGFPMAPSPLTGLFYFYFPNTDQPYVPYEFLQGPEVSTVPGTYTPVVGDAAALQARQEAGHVASPLSGRSSVGMCSWMSEEEARDALQQGMVVSENPDIYTWSADGLYLLSTEADFWELPPGAEPSSNGGTLPRAPEARSGRPALPAGHR